MFYCFNHLDQLNIYGCSACGLLHLVVISVILYYGGLLLQCVCGIGPSRFTTYLRFIYYWKNYSFVQRIWWKLILQSSHRLCPCFWSQHLLPFYCVLQSRVGCSTMWSFICTSLPKPIWIILWGRSIDVLAKIKLFNWNMENGMI